LSPSARKWPQALILKCAVSSTGFAVWPHRLISASAIV